jgi:hypothetical protein
MPMIKCLIFELLCLDFLNFIQPKKENKFCVHLCVCVCMKASITKYGLDLWYGVMMFGESIIRCEIVTF